MIKRILVDGTVLEAPKEEMKEKVQDHSCTFKVHFEPRRDKGLEGFHIWGEYEYTKNDDNYIISNLGLDDAIHAGGDHFRISRRTFKMFFYEYPEDTNVCPECGNRYPNFKKVGCFNC